MKTRFDHKSVTREFQPGYLVLVLLTVHGAILLAKFAGPDLVWKYAFYNTIWAKETAFMIQLLSDFFGDFKYEM